MRKTMNLNNQWQFYLGEAGIPRKMAKKAGAIGGLTQPISETLADKLPISAGGEHFLNLISQGKMEKGIAELAGMDLTTVMDDSWQEIKLPHDWKVELPFINDPKLLMSGSKEHGIGYYRKTFTLNENADPKMILRFEGIMGIASIWLNGIFLGENYSGYTEIDLDVTEMLRYQGEGENVLLVRVDTTQGEEGWWYDGAGIYRNVTLLSVPKLHIDLDAFYLFTKEIGSTAVLGSELTIVNDSYEPQSFLTELTIAGKTYTYEPMTLAPQTTQVLTRDFEIEEPALWSPEHPNLYEAQVRIYQNDQLHDQIQKKFGIRSFAYDENGFYLNQQPYQLRGVCEHQDFAGVGTAVTREMNRYKLEKIKKMGSNAYRSAHHFASRDLLELCDELGILVMNENRILETSPWRLNDLETMVIKSRMSPSVCFWSLSNEEVIGNTMFAHRMAERLCALIRSIDYEHLLVSAELLNPNGIVDEDYMKNFDVVGVNYPEAGVMGAGLKKIKEKYPHQPLMCTENASYFSTRGIYRDNAEKCQTNNLGSMYSMVLPGERQPGDPGVGGTAHPEEVMTFLTENPYMGGVFLWTAFDYAGEPSPFTWPAISSQFGIMDRCGFEKDYYYYYQAQWTTQPMVHLLPHWNEDGLSFNEKGETEIRVFTNCEEVELFLNDKSLGKQLAGVHSNSWWTPFKIGELKVVAYRDGKIVATDQKQTAIDDEHLTLTTEFDHGSLLLIKLQAIDQARQISPMSERAVHVHVEQGRVIALANGNPMDHSKPSKDHIALFSGKAMLLVEKEEGYEPIVRVEVVK